MTHGQSQRVEHHLCRMLDQIENDPATDRQLLERFRQQGDEAAFGTLVRRHGPLILSVCRSLLRDPDEAEDVYQATWLVLASKIQAVAWRDSIAGWLYEVAHRLALKARSRSARRHARFERLEQEPLAPGAPTFDEARWLLDEVARLPEKYRAPLVLCYLEGKNHADAARALNCPVGSMSRRLARGLELLRERLQRRGHDVAPATLGAMLTHCGISASGLILPAGWSESITPLAIALASGKTTLATLASGSVVSLVQGVVRDMTLQQFKFVSVAALVLLLGGAGLGVLSHYSATARPPAAPPAVEPARMPPTPARQLTAGQILTVYQIVEGQTHPRKLGMTLPQVPVRGIGGGIPKQFQKPQAVPIPANAVWYVQYSSGFAFGAVGFGGGGGFGGGVGFGGGFGVAGGGQNIGGGGGQNIGGGGAGLFGNAGGAGILGGGPPMAGQPALRKLTGQELAGLAAELKKQQIPGLRLENVELSDDDLAILVKDAPHLQTLLLYNTKTTDAGLRHLTRLPNLRILGLEGSEFTDRALDTVASIKTLDTLRLGGAKFTSKGFSIVGEIKSLRTLRLTWMQIDATGLGALTKLPNLEELEIVGPVDDAALEQLKNAPALKQVRLHFAKIGGKGLETICNLEKLDQLTLDWMWGEEGPMAAGYFGRFGGGGIGGGGIGGFGALGGAGGQAGQPAAGGFEIQVPTTTSTPDGTPREKPAPGLKPADLNVLSNARNLTSLVLMGKDFGDDEAERLKGCVGLKKLDLFAPNLTDQGLRPLKDLKALERLNICISKVTPAGTATLRLLPSLKVLFAPLMPLDPNYKRELAQFRAALPRVQVQTLSSLPGLEGIQIKGGR